eukprot:TRINITY_DN38086_c0_g1_i3.p1 TRINITY_DN38086_c0_g1~~TRINITY_DN38086_c0_g1_i3.p1  ORF type:complete len:712 (-),score=125.03 TRINITY_DN38086_c0_g1_i3:43-2178(-)
MPAQLIDVTPARVRFTGAPGASLTRNVLIRNVSVSELEFEVRAPAGPLFRISRGAEHVGRAVKLPPGEALDLQVMFDPKALAADRGSWNVDGRFLAVLVDMCEPVLMELVVAPEHISAEEVAEATQSLRAAFRSSLSKEVHAKAATMRLPAVAASSQPADASSEDRRRANSPRLLEMLDLLPQEMLPQEMRRGPGIPVTEETAALILPAQPEEDRDPLSDLLAEAERDYTQVVGENQLEGEREEQEEPASTAFRGVVPVAALRGRSFQKVPMRNGVIDVRDASSSGDEGDDDGNDSVNGSKVGSPAKQRLRHQGSGYAQRQPPAGHHLLAAPAVDQTLPGFSSGGSAPSAPSRRSPSAGVAAATTVSAAGAQLDAGAAALAAFLGEVPAAAALRGRPSFQTRSFRRLRGLNATEWQLRADLLQVSSWVAGSRRRQAADTDAGRHGELRCYAAASRDRREAGSAVRFRPWQPSRQHRGGQAQQRRPRQQLAGLGGRSGRWRHRRRSIHGHRHGGEARSKRKRPRSRKSVALGCWGSHAFFRRLFEVQRCDSLDDGLRASCPSWRLLPRWLLLHGRPRVVRCLRPHCSSRRPSRRPRSRGDHSSGSAIQGGFRRGDVARRPRLRPLSRPSAVKSAEAGGSGEGGLAADAKRRCLSAAAAGAGRVGIQGGAEEVDEWSGQHPAANDGSKQIRPEASADELGLHWRHLRALASLC